MELVKTHQVNRYIAAQGPMQHTSRDFWQVNVLCIITNKQVIWVRGCYCMACVFMSSQAPTHLYTNACVPSTDDLGTREHLDHNVNTHYRGWKGMLGQPNLSTGNDNQWYFFLFR